MFDHWAVVWLAPVAVWILTIFFIDIVSSFVIRPFPGQGDAELAHAVQRRIAIWCCCGQEHRVIGQMFEHDH